MSAPNLSNICVTLLGYIKDKCAKLKLPLTVTLPTYKPPPGSSNSTPPRDVLALTYDCLYCIMEEVMLVEMKMKAGVEQAAAYLSKLSGVWSGSRDVAAFLDGDARQFWISSFPEGVVAVPWAEMEAKLIAWTNNKLPVLWPKPIPAARTQAARSLQLRLEGSLSGYVSALSLSLFVYKSSLIDGLTNFCAEEPYKSPTSDIVITIGFPKDTEVSLRKSGFIVHNITSWMDFKMWLFAQKDVRAMMKSESNIAEFIVSNATHPGSNCLGEEVVRYLRGRRFYCPVTIVGVANNIIRHNYENLFLAPDLINVWSLNRYHRPEFTKVAESSANLLRQAPKHHKNDLVDTFSYKNFNLPALPPITCQLQWMRILILEDNALEHLPVSIGGLTSLFRLTLTSNKLHYIPTSISSLTQLRELNINKNKFSTISEHVCKLAGLKVLNLANNPLASLPAAITKLTSLGELDIRATPTLTQLPHSMGDMTGLQQLSADKDAFENYPRAFAEGDTTEKLRFLKDLQPEAVKDCQTLIMLGRDASYVLRNLAGTKKLSNGMHEMELKAEGDKSVTYLVWDFSGKDINIETAFFTRSAIYMIVENSRSNETIFKYKEIVKSVIPDANIVAVYTFPFTAEEDDFSPSDVQCRGYLCQANDDFKQKFIELVPSINEQRPPIPTAYLQFSKFIQEQNKMFMNWNEVIRHAKCYTDEPNVMVNFLIANGYLFYHGPPLEGTVPPSIYECIFVLSPAMNLVAQLKKTTKGFQMMKKEYFTTILRKLCIDNVDFATIVSLLEKCKVIHSVDSENVFMVPFIPTYTQAQPFAEVTDYPVNLVRMYAGEEKLFSLDWFLNVVTGIHSRCDGNISLSSIDTHNAVITFDFSPQQDISPSQRAISSPHLARSPQLSSSSAQRMISLQASTTSLPISHHPPSPVEDFSSPRSPLPPSIPLTTIVSSPQLNINTSPELTKPAPSIRCYLHRTSNNRHFWFVLSSPTLSPVALKIFHTVLRVIEWLLQHWVDSAFYEFSTSCHSCFDMNSFLKSKTATCPIKDNKILDALQDELECLECKQLVEIRHIAPDLALPSVLDQRVDQSKLNKETKIADGGCGKVYRTQLSGKQAVIKTSNIKGLDYLREIVLTSSFNHANVITCVGYARAPQAMLLEYAPCGSLHAAIEANTKFSLPLITRIALEIARGMRYIHDCGVANRDLKSDNVLLMALDTKSSDPLVKLTDFGTSGHHMGFSAKFNTYGGDYNKPPEACTKEPVDMILADIYCYGLILWELFAEKTLESYHKEADQQRKKAGQASIDPSKLHDLYKPSALPAATASHPLRAIMLECLQEYPSKRITSFDKIEERIRAM